MNQKINTGADYTPEHGVANSLRRRQRAPVLSRQFQTLLSWKSVSGHCLNHFLGPRFCVSNLVVMEVGQRHPVEWKGSDPNGTRLSVNPIDERRWDGEMEFQDVKCTSEFMVAFARTP